MLKQLSINNYAIIDRLELDFINDFTVITGETGAGKSILLGALSLILGQRADTSVLHDQDKKCVVEGSFELPESISPEFFDRNDLDYEIVTQIRREINSKGKSRAFINDTPVSLQILKELTSQLVNIHTQFDTLQIVDNQFQVDVIDAFAGLKKNVVDYKKKFLYYTKVKKQLKELVELESNASSDLDYILFQIKEIEELNLQPNEQESIEKELELLNNAEDIKSVFDQSSNAFNSDQSILSILNELSAAYKRISGCSEEIAEMATRMEQVSIELSDIAREVDLMNDRFEYDPERLHLLNDRLNKIYTLEQKHRLQHSDELLALLEELSGKVGQQNSMEEEINALKIEMEGLEKELVDKANAISTKRLKSVPKFCKTIEQDLIDLGMPDASFKVNRTQAETLLVSGLDKLEFMFSANKGVEEKSLDKAASGGELSRLMLTIKSVLAQNSSLSAIVFDEIDTGVSGDIADKMGEIMKGMAANIQVIAITHLPQVAAKGVSHFKVYKENKEGKTRTIVQSLNKDERINEIAKMLSGKNLSEAAIDNARNLISFN